MALTGRERAARHRAKRAAERAALLAAVGGKVATTVSEVVSAADLSSLSRLVDELYEAGSLKTPARLRLREWIGERR